MLCVPGRLGQLRRDGERHVALRLRVTEAEVVDHLLDADRIRRRQTSLVEEATDVGIRRSVDVDRKRRQRLVGDSTEGVFGNRGIRLGVWRRMRFVLWSARVAERTGAALRLAER